MASLPSVLWRCWLGGRKGIRTVKNWVVRCWHGYLYEQGADYMAHLMPLPLTISCSSKSRLVLPSWFYLSGTGSPGYSRTQSRRLKAVVAVSGRTRVSWHQKGKPFWILLNQEMMGGSDTVTSAELNHMQIISLVQGLTCPGHIIQHSILVSFYRVQVKHNISFAFDR